jgi:hypothetical protein
MPLAASSSRIYHLLLSLCPSDLLFQLSARVHDLNVDTTIFADLGEPR